ncbi:hypothetical protein ACVIGB_000596 [Bradyrhizobium sp. USDA 4341]
MAQMNANQEFTATINALLDFILKNRTHRPKAQDGVTPTMAIEAMRRSYSSGDWIADGSADVLRLFLYNAPLLADVLEPITFREANSSTDASYDPLTLDGLGDVTHFIHNGLVDDWWIALYEKDGVRRIVHEVVDDCVQSGGKGWPQDGFKRLDRDLEWMHNAHRTVLNMKRFGELFAKDMKSIPTHVPDAGELMELWTSRPYDDFCSAPSP